MLSNDALLALTFVEEFSSVARLGNDVLEEALPGYILSSYRSHLEATIP